MAGLDRARRHRRRGGLVPDAAGLAPHQPADRAGCGPRHGLRLARADRRDVARRGGRRRSHSHAHPHPRRRRGRRQSRARAATRSRATSTSTAPTKKSCSAAPCRMAACAFRTATSSRCSTGSAKATTSTWRRPSSGLSRSDRQRAVPLRRACRRRDERARPVPGHDRRRGERKRPGLRPRRAPRFARPARTSRHRGHASRRKRARPRLRRARRLDGGRGKRAGLCRGARARHSHRPPLGTSRPFRGAATLHRGHRHERQVHGHGDGVRDPERRRRAILPSSPAAICPSFRRKASPAMPLPGDSDLLVVEADESDGTLIRYAPAIGVILNLQRDHKEIEDVAAMFATLAGAGRARRWSWAMPRISIRSPAARFASASASAPMCAARMWRSVRTGAGFASAMWRSSCRCRERITSSMRSAAIATASVAGRAA